jgi:hypothetical protein
VVIVDFKKYRIKLHKAANSKSGSFRRYSLTYSPRGENSSLVAYNIVAALAAGNDVVMELDSDLFPRGKINDMSYSEKLLADIHSLGLVHSHKKVPSERQTTYFGIPANRKKVEMVDKIAVYVPNGVWMFESFKDVIPACGARFYVVKGSMDADTAVNAIWSLSEEAKASTYLLSVFCLVEIGQMGITSETLGEREIKSILGIG